MDYLARALLLAHGILHHADLLSDDYSVRELSDVGVHCPGGAQLDGEHF